MTDEEKELLLRYQQYTRKRNMIIATIIIVAITISLVLGFYFFGKNKTDTVKKENVEVLPPVLELTVDSIEISQNEEINYDSYIKVAKDKEDGDLKDKVEYNKIDTSVIGEYEVKYLLENSRHKKVEKKLKVKVNEVVQVQEPQEPEPNPTQDTNTSNNQNNISGSTSTSQNTTSSNTNNQSNTTSKKTESSSSNNTSAPRTRDFLFSDGYDMSNVGSVCASSLSGHKGRCDPIYDSDGIIIGMRATIE